MFFPSVVLKGGKSGVCIQKVRQSHSPLDRESEVTNRNKGWEGRNRINNIINGLYSMDNMFMVGKLLFLFSTGPADKYSTGLLYFSATTRIVYKVQTKIRGACRLCYGRENFFPFRTKIIKD